MTEYCQHRSKQSFTERLHNSKKAIIWMTGCHVVISELPPHQQHRYRFTVRINIAFPGGEAVVTRDDNEDVYLLLREAFAEAERELENSAPARCDAVTHHDLQT